MLGIGNLMGRCSGHLSMLWLLELRSTLDMFWTRDGKLELCESSKVRGNADVGKAVMKGLRSGRISVKQVERCMTYMIAVVDAQDLGQ